MLIISIKIVEMHVEDQKNIYKMIDDLISICGGNIIKLYVNRNGLICYLDNIKIDNIKHDLLHVLKEFKWHTPMRWGSVINSTTIIESIYLSYNNIPYNGFIDIIPLVDSILISNDSSSYNIEKIRLQLKQYDIKDTLLLEKFIDYYAHLYTNSDVYRITHASHNIPNSIWYKFAYEYEHLFIPIDNSSILTCLKHNQSNLIGINALIADVNNMIHRDVNKFHNINVDNMIYAINYSYKQHLESMEKYINIFKSYFDVKEFNNNWLKYYFIDNYCELVQQYPDLRGEITKLIYIKDVEIIDAIVKLQPNDNNNINLCIFCICYDRIIWAYNNNYLPTGRGDSMGIKKNMRIILDIWMKHKIDIFDHLPIYLQQFIEKQLLLNNTYLKYFKPRYYNHNIELTDVQIKIINRIKNLGMLLNIDNSSQHILNNIEINILKLLDNINNINIVLHNVNEYMNINIIKGNSTREYVLYSVYNYLNQYLI